MERRTERGFTLVELLVVIAIIGMLMALLMPAINAARESGRRLQCMNNLKSIGNGLVAYASTHSTYPGLRYSLPTKSGDAAANWFVALMPYIDRADIYRKWTDAAPTEQRYRFMWLLICPSDPPDNRAVTDTPTSYTANALILGDQAGGSGYGAVPPRSQEYVYENDGATTTLLASENLRIDKAHNWTDVDTASLLKIGFGTPTSWANGDYAKLAALFPTTMVGNIRSAHNGGCVVVYCDGHGGFLRDDANTIPNPPGTLYQALVTPDGTSSTANETPVDESQLGGG